MMRFLAALLLTAALAGVAEAQTADVFKVYAGVNGIWYNGDLNLPADVEVGMTGRASLSPHISAVGGGFYGFDSSYLRGYVGGRITATDVNDPNFSIGIGLCYHVSSEEKVRPQEWASDVSVGWKPFPEKLQRITVGAQATYGFDSKQVGLLAGLRYALNIF